MENTCNYRYTYIENQSGVARNIWWHTSATVGKLGRDGQSSFTIDLHTNNSQIPSTDDFLSANDEAEWLSTGVGVEYFVVLLQTTRVTDVDLQCRN